MANLETIQQVLLTLSAAYEHPLQESTIAVYACALTDVPDRSLKRAAATHISRSIYFPRIAELRNLALSGRHPDPIEAWGEVLAQIRQVGFYGKPDFSSPLIARAVQDLGWAAICQSGNLPSERARFVQAYETLVRRENDESAAFPEWDSLELPPGLRAKNAGSGGRNNGKNGGRKAAHLPFAGDKGA